jgi:hypothetical protein
MPCYCLKVKNLAKLALFFSLTFAIILLVSTFLRFLGLRVDWARTLPQRPQAVLTAIIAAAHWALPLTLYGSILLSLSYAVRGRYSALMTVACVFILSICFGFGISSALDHWASVPPAQDSSVPLGESGLVLSNTLTKNETAIVLLKGPAEPLGPRVAAVPDRPLLFQEETDFDAEFDLPPVPFGDDTPWFLKSLSIDLRLSGEQLQRRFGEGAFSFLIYTGALVCFLGSLGFILRFSVWPLANIFLGALAFRGILSLETFFNSPEMQEVFGSFLRNRISPVLTVPLIFLFFGLLVHTYSVLVYIAKRRDDD